MPEDQQHGGMAEGSAVGDSMELQENDEGMEDESMKQRGEIPTEVSEDGMVIKCTLRCHWFLPLPQRWSHSLSFPCSLAPLIDERPLRNGRAKRLFTKKSRKIR